MVTLYQIDTLNKQDLIPKNKLNITITDMGLLSGKKIDYQTDKSKNIGKIPIPCTVALKGDTLVIMLPTAFPPNVVHKIINGQLTSTYEEHLWRDTIFRLNLTQPKTNHLSIPVKTPVFKLSTLSFKAGQFLYGEIEYITDPYCVDDSDFKTNYINKRIHCKYVFRTGIVDLNKP